MILRPSLILIDFFMSQILKSFLLFRNSCLGLQNRQDQLFPFKVHLGAEVRKVSLGLDHSGALCRPFV